MIVSSMDGINWTKRNSGVASDLVSVSWGNGFYVAVGNNVNDVTPALSPVILTSRDGVNWTVRNPAQSEFGLLGSGFVNNRFVAVGVGGTVMESDDTGTAPLALSLEPGVGSVRLTVVAPAGSGFRIQGCTNLFTSGWVDLVSLKNVSEVTHWTNTTIGAERQFFRVVSP
jgi:hypothetical protein